MDAVREHFRPELLNRIDEIVIFHPLGQEQIKQIVDIQLAGCASAWPSARSSSSSPTPPRSCWRARASTRSTARGR